MGLCVPGTIGDARQRQDKGLREGWTRRWAQRGRGHAAGEPLPVPEALLHQVGPSSATGTGTCGRALSPGWLVPVPVAVAAPGGDRRWVALAASPCAAFPMTPGPAGWQLPRGHRRATNSVPTSPVPPASPGSARLRGGSARDGTRPPPARPQGPELGFLGGFCPSMSPGSVPGRDAVPHGTWLPEQRLTEAFEDSRRLGIVAPGTRGVTGRSRPSPGSLEPGAPWQELGLLS